MDSDCCCLYFTGHFKSLSPIRVCEFLTNIIRPKSWFAFSPLPILQLAGYVSTHFRRTWGTKDAGKSTRGISSISRSETFPIAPPALTSGFR
jgi:hypothetical protein